eukprot:400729-Rhodomonas_salina.1
MVQGPGSMVQGPGSRVEETLTRARTLVSLMHTCAIKTGLAAPPLFIVFFFFLCALHVTSCHVCCLPMCLLRHFQSTDVADHATRSPVLTCYTASLVLRCCMLLRTRATGSPVLTRSVWYQGRGSHGCDGNS